MAETLPINFPLETENVIASYSATDLADGTGVIVFKGYNSNEEGTDDYHLSEQTISSNDVISRDLAGSTYSDYTLRMDHDYDLTPFNTARTIEGTAKISITVGGYSSSTTGDKQIYYIAKLRKWDGSTETEIANAQSENMPHNSATGTKSKTLTVSIPITTAVNFAAGETFRITIEIWIKKNTDNADFGYGHDPDDRNDTVSTNRFIISDADTTVFKAHVPFKIDV